MTRNKKIAVWMVWALVWPASVYGLFVFLDPALQGNFIEIVAFVALACIVALFPLQVGDNPVFLTNGIAFAAFLYYGLFVEIVISQLALLFLFAKLKIGFSQLQRIPINLLMFLMISCGSALMFILLGGQYGTASVTSISNVIPTIAYIATQILLNLLLLKGIDKVLYNRKSKGPWFDKGFWLDVATALVVFPFGYLLYMGFVEFGISAFVFVGLPFVLISGMLMLYHNSRQINSYLKKTSTIGHELTGNLGVKDVLDLFVKRLSELLPVDYIYIFDVASQNQLKLIRFFDRSGELTFTSIRPHKGEGVSGYTWKEEKSFRYNKRKDWAHLENEHTPPRAESALSVPIVRNDQIVGIISIYSRQKHAFLQYQFMLMNILGNYLGVAIANARHYEITKEESIRCGLTGLYNFRYFEDKIHDIFQKTQDPERDPISLILLDIDHFKRVNDTYGHESGNEILCQLAACLESQFEDSGIVARYGGEEFVILLPNVSPLEAYSMAEKLRLHIASHPFTACQHILDYDESVRMEITASIGVASYPNDCEEPLELIRHADRAMYMGAKRRGRNRVATYANMKTAAEL